MEMTTRSRSNTSSCQEEQELLDFTTSEVRTSVCRALESINDFCSKHEEKNSELVNSSSLHLKPGSVSFMSFCQRNNLWKHVLEALLSTGGAPLSRITQFLVRELEESYLNDLEDDQKSNKKPKEVKEKETKEVETNNEFCIDELLASPKSAPVRKPDKRTDFLSTFKDVGISLDDLLGSPKPEPQATEEVVEETKPDCSQVEETESGPSSSVDALEERNRDKVYTCPECNYQTNYRAMRAHLKKALSGRRLDRKCGECDYETRYEGCFKMHLRIHRSADHFCPRCDFVGKNGKELDRHLLSHILDLDPTVLQCGKCKYNTKSKKLLAKHKAKHKHGGGTGKKRKLKDKSYCCSECDFVAVKKKMLTIHMRKKHLPPIKCEQCSYSTHSKEFLKRHAISHSEERPFPCKFCQYASKTKVELRRHLLTHSDTKQFKCSICDYGTNKQSCLKTHMLNHSGDHLYKCHICPYGTNTNESRLKNHMMIHFDDKPFKCEEFGCNYETKNKRLLKMHGYVHTGEKRLFCNHYGCLYGTNYRKDLNAHILNAHTNQKLFKCDSCNYATNLKTNLNLHKKHCGGVNRDNTKQQLQHMPTYAKQLTDALALSKQQTHVPEYSKHQTDVSAYSKQLSDAVLLSKQNTDFSKHPADTSAYSKQLSDVLAQSKQHTQVNNYSKQPCDASAYSKHLSDALAQSRQQINPSDFTKQQVDMPIYSKQLTDALALSRQQMHMPEFSKQNDVLALTKQQTHMPDYSKQQTDLLSLSKQQLLPGEYLKHQSDVTPHSKLQTHSLSYSKEQTLPLTNQRLQDDSSHLKQEAHQPAHSKHQVHMPSHSRQQNLIPAHSRQQSLYAPVPNYGGERGLLESYTPLASLIYGAGGYRN